MLKGLRNVKFDIIRVSYTKRLLFLMFVTAVCVLFLVMDKTRQDNALFGVLYSPMYIDFIQII